MLLIDGCRTRRWNCIGDLHRNEHWRGRQLLLPATQNASGDAIAACDLGKACVWLSCLCEDPASILMGLLSRWKEYRKIRPMDDELPTPLDFLKAVYCNEGLPLGTRLRAAMAASSEARCNNAGYPIKRSCRTLDASYRCKPAGP